MQIIATFTKFMCYYRKHLGIIHKNGLKYEKI